jgi:hypothetical protein
MRGRRGQRRGVGGRRGILTAAIAVLVIAGGTMVGVAVSAQKSPANVPGDSVGPSPGAAAPGPPRHSGTPTSSPSTTGPILAASRPVSIRIPAIGVRSSLIEVGLNADGSLQVPHGANYQKAAWYRNSPTPGELGPSIIEGHVDSHRGPAVFFKLGDLRPGDKVDVARADGSTAQFAVRRVAEYPKEHFPTHAVYHNLDHAGLRLITCGGTFDHATGHYLNNIVAYAKLVKGSRG